MNEMKQTCNHNHDEITLLFYGELDDVQRNIVEDRMATCDSCQQAHDSLAALAQIVPTQPYLDLDDASMEAIRSATLRRINEQSVVPRASYSLIPGWKRSAQWSLVAAMVFISFWAGGLQKVTPAFFAAPALEQTQNVSGIEYDEQNGIVQISFEKLSESSVSGNVSDSAVQSLLGTALMNTENPASRLAAARILALSNFSKSEPDPQLLSALESVLVTESNPGIRLQAVKALRTVVAFVPLNESLKSSLIEVLLNDSNSAIRIEVMDLLTENEVTSRDMKALFEQAQEDSNPLIRRKAGLLLEDLEPAGRLEEIR